MSHWLRMHRPNRLGYLVWLLIAVLFVLSIFATVTLLSGAFRDGSPFYGETSWSLTGFKASYGTSAGHDAIRNSLILAAFTMSVGTGVGFLFAWAATRTNVLAARLLTPVMVVTIALPSLFIGLGWAVLGNTKVGTINTLWRHLTGSDGALFNIYGWPGLIGLSIIKPIAISYLLFYGPCRSLSRELEEASVLMGTSVMLTMTRITIPIMAPTLLAVGIINLIIGLEAFDIPALIAPPAGISLLSTEVYRLIHERIPADYPAASALSLGICISVLMLVALRWRLISRHNYATVTGKAKSNVRWDTGRWGPVLSVMIIGYAVLALILPIAQLVLGSLQPLFGSFGRMGLSNYRTVLSDPSTIQSIVRTLTIGIGGGFLAMIFTLAVAYTVRHARTRRAVKLLDFATWLPAALPGIVLGLALSWAYLSLPFLRPFYGTPLMLILALMVAGMPLAARAAESGLLQVHHELEEAARIGGASRCRAVVDILLPLIAPSFLAGWLITALYVAGRLDVPVLLATPNHQLAIVSVYELYTNGRTGEAAAVLCLLLAGFLTVTFIMVVGALLLRRFLMRRSFDTPQAEAPPRDDVAASEPKDRLVMSVEKEAFNG